MTGGTKPKQNRDIFVDIALILHESLASAHLEVTLRRAVRLSLAMCGGQEASITLRDAGTRRLRIAAQYGKPPRLASHAKATGANAIISWVMRHKQALVLKGDLSGSRFAGYAKKRLILSSMCLPIMIGRRCLGALCLNVTDPASAFAAGSLGKGAIMATIAAAAINHSVLEKKLKEKFLELSRKHQSLVQYQDRAIIGERLSSLGIMAASIAHELKSPLTTIMTYAELLKNQNLPQAVRDRGLTAVDSEAHRMGNICRQLLAYSHQEENFAEEIDVNELIRNTLAFTRHHLERFENVTVSLCLADNLPKICADPGQIQQVFVNMILNAAQAMKSGNLTITSHLTAGDSLEAVAPEDFYELVDKSDKKFVGVTFHDTGPGVDPKNLDKLFLPFFTTKKRGEGTGLGLFICKNIVNNFGGFIHVAPNPGTGAAFTIYLQACATAATAADAKPTKNENTGATPV